MTVLITVLGVVQGVGFRPFVARTAEALGIRGTVRNSGGIVQIVAEGKKEAIDDFVRRLRFHQPSGAQVTQILTKELPDRQFDAFTILASGQCEEEIPLIPPDLPLCDACRKELRDPRNRRYRHPFISCVACGPRYSIINALPYDRGTTTMEDFPMCAQCEAEYRQEDNRRRHAQTISCFDCGPQLILKTPDGVFYAEQALQAGTELLKAGKVIAVKGIGGYQFACLPKDEQAARRLRLLKRRDRKPFAVMFPDLPSLKIYCQTDGEEEKLLLSAARPIVLLKKKKDFCPSVSGESRFIGAFLAYTSLHQLLTDACGALVMTSGNLTNEPILIRDEEMLALESEHLAGVLYHERRIVTPLDDSVARVACGIPQVVRRSRGYVPLPVFLHRSAGEPVLAMGGDLKSCFCLYPNDRAYVSQYFGDMEDYRVEQVYQENLRRMETLFGIRPKVIAHDRHPGYFTTRLAEKIAEERSLRRVTVQHHHAHAASVMAEHALSSCIGVVFDGTGYGTDGAVWGGEFLLCKGAGFERRAHLGYVTLTGGDAAAKNAKLTAYGYLCAAGRTAPDEAFGIAKAAIDHRVQTRRSSSMGRLFDAVSAVLELRAANTYEGECAIALENAAAAHLERGGEPYPLCFAVSRQPDGVIADQGKLVDDIRGAYEAGADRGALALGFHRAVAGMVLTVCRRIREDCGENTVALSGGVFANLLLTEDCVRRLESDGFRVFMNAAVPANDGGVCLGQAWIAGQS